MEASRVQTLILLLIALDLPGCNAYGPQPQNDARKITLAVVQSKSATIKHSYLCRIESHRHMEVRTDADGHLSAVLVKEGQAVKRGDLLFQVGPPMDKERPEAENGGGTAIGANTVWCRRNATDSLSRSTTSSRKTMKERAHIITCVYVFFACNRHKGPIIAGATEASDANKAQRGAGDAAPLVAFHVTADDDSGRIRRIRFRLPELGGQRAGGFR